MSRGILDTGTLILIGRIDDTDTLPDEPQITAITLAELSVGPLVASTDEERSAVRPTFNKQKPTSSHCLLMQPRPAVSVR